MTREGPRIPICTYRLQFNREFTFRCAREIVPYLNSLGISDAYSSPYFQARAESLHGYDITDHNKLNAAIGSREEYDAWIAELQAHKMGQVVDFVPNHMGIGEPLNVWWQDVLENGPSSAYARYFDIDWRPLKTELHDRVLLPILGDQYGRVLERGELQLSFHEGTFTLHYYDNVLPVAPGTYRYVLEIALENLAEFKNEDFYAEFQSVLTALEYLPKRTETDPERIAERAREKEIIKRRLERRCEEAPQLQQAIDKALARINAKPGDGRSFDALDELLNAQSYRLAFWRVAAEEINYRRFFDVNDLAAIRQEIPEVFDSTHRLLVDLVRAGAVTGLRIDHPDGLYLPREYFEKLQQRCAEALGKRESPHPDLLPAGEGTRISTPARENALSRGERRTRSASEGNGILTDQPNDHRAIYMVIEKILTGNEALRQDWAVHGTTGYDFASDVAQLLVDQSAEAAITKAFQKFLGHSLHFGHLVYAKKLQVMKLALANDVNVLGNTVDRLSEQNRWFRDFTLQALTSAVRETIACFPVYRTYVEPGRVQHEEDRQVVERAIAAAKRRNPGIEASVFNFLRDLLLLRFPENLDEQAQNEHTEFVLKFQQYTGPIMAKGVEDTVFYIFNRLAALNEVGGEPQRFGSGVEAFHQRVQNRQRDWPDTMLTTSTHDTKRSEDVRARMVAISEMPQMWRQFIKRARMFNRRWKTRFEDLEAPDANEEYLLYQTLLGTWPIDGSGAAQKEASGEYCERIQAYMRKALNEAKLNTSWIQPNEEWLGAMHDFVDKILSPSAKNKFLPLLYPLAEEVARLGAINSLTQTLLKLTSPGVPDIYQGNEIWDFSLVDPDNRRPVDHKLLREMLASLAGCSPQALWESWPDGRIKMFLIQRTLQLRNQLARGRVRPDGGHVDLFQRGSYLPIGMGGEFADCGVSFARELDGKWVIVVAPRISSRVGFPPIGEKWKDTVLNLPENAPAKVRDIFTGLEIEAKDRQAKLADVFSVLPFAVLTNVNA